MFRMVKEKRLYKNYENSIYWIYPWYSEMLSYPGTLVLWRVHFESNASCRVCKWTGELSFRLIRDSLWFSFQPEKTSEAAVVDPESQVWHFLPQSSSSNSAVLSRQSYMIINSLLLLAMQFVNGNWWKITFAKRRVQTNIFNVSLFVECHIRVVNIRKSHLRKSYLVGLPESISHQEVPPQLLCTICIVFALLDIYPAGFSGSKYF